MNRETNLSLLVVRLNYTSIVEAEIAKDAEQIAERLRRIEPPKTITLENQRRTTKNERN